MVINIRLLLALTTLAAAVIFMAHAALASVNPTSGQQRPGWGYGDQNHVHTGPPGLSNRP